MVLGFQGVVLAVTGQSPCGVPRECIGSQKSVSLWGFHGAALAVMGQCLCGGSRGVALAVRGPGFALKVKARTPCGGSRGKSAQKRGETLTL